VDLYLKTEKQLAGWMTSKKSRTFVLLRISAGSSDAAKAAQKLGSFGKKLRSGFRVRTSRSACALLSRPQGASKCNEALSRDLWPLDPFESAPMRATSSVLFHCILCAISHRLKIKGLSELLDGKAGRNSLTLKKLLCEIY